MYVTTFKINIHVEGNGFSIRKWISDILRCSNSIWMQTGGNWTFFSLKYVNHQNKIRSSLPAAPAKHKILGGFLIESPHMMLPCILSYETRRGKEKLCWNYFVQNINCVVCSWWCCSLLFTYTCFFVICTFIHIPIQNTLHYADYDFFGEFRVNRFGLDVMFSIEKISQPK